MNTSLKDRPQQPEDSDLLLDLLTDLCQSNMILYGIPCLVLYDQPMHFKIHTVYDNASMVVHILDEETFDCDHVAVIKVGTMGPYKMTRQQNIDYTIKTSRDNLNELLNSLLVEKG